MESAIIRKHLPTSITSSPINKSSKLKNINTSVVDQPCAKVNASNATTLTNITSTTTGESNTIPSAAELKPFAQKCGHLKKLSGRNIWNVGTWRDRYCLLVKNKLYYFENEESQGTEKSAGFVNLNDFTTCLSPEGTTRVTKKVINVFVIGMSESKGFFESNRDYYFAADTLEQLNEWMTAINERMRHHRSIQSSSPAETKRRQETPAKEKLERSTTSTKCQKQETPTSHHRKSGATISSGTGSGSGSVVNLASILKSPRAERSLSIFQDGSRKKMKSGASNGDNQLIMSSLPSSPTEQKLDFSVAKGRVKGPPGRRLPRKSSPYKDVSSSNSQNDLLTNESGANGAENADDQILSRSHRAKSLCLLDKDGVGPGDDDSLQLPNSRAETIEMKSCRKNAHALKRLSAAISLSNATNGAAGVVNGAYDGSKDEYWNGANGTKSIDLIDLDYGESMGKHELVQNNPRKNPSIELKRKSISIMAYASESSCSSSNEEVNNVGLKLQLPEMLSSNQGANRAAACGREEKVIVQRMQSTSPNLNGNTKTTGQKPSAEVPTRGKCPPGGTRANVAMGEELAYKGLPEHNGNGTSTPILKRYHKRDSASMTPSPCVLRKLREAILAASQKTNDRKYFNDEDSDSQDETITMIDSNQASPSSTVTRSSRRARNLSGPSTSSSLSTLTHISGIGKGEYKLNATKCDEKQVAYSSLHRPSLPKQVYGNGGMLHPQYLKSCLSANQAHSRGYASASASPLLNGQNGGSRRLAGLANSNSIQSIENYAYANGSASANQGNQGNDLNHLSISFLGSSLETLKHEFGAAKQEARQLQSDMGSLRQDVGNLAESIISVHKTLVDTQDKMGQLGAQVINIERQISTIVKETNTIRNHAEKLLESAESSKRNYNLLEEEARSLVGYLKDVVLHYSALCNCCSSEDVQPSGNSKLIFSNHAEGNSTQLSKCDGSHRNMTICGSRDAARRNYLNDCLKDLPKPTAKSPGNDEDIIEYPLG